MRHVLSLSLLGLACLYKCGSGAKCRATQAPRSPGGLVSAYGPHLAGRSIWKIDHCGVSNARDVRARSRRGIGLRPRRGACVVMCVWTAPLPSRRGHAFRARRAMRSRTRREAAAEISSTDPDYPELPRVPSRIFGLRIRARPAGAAGSACASENRPAWKTRELQDTAVRSHGPRGRGGADPPSDRDHRSTVATPIRITGEKIRYRGDSQSDVCVIVYFALRAPLALH